MTYDEKVKSLNAQIAQLQESLEHLKNNPAEVRAREERIKNLKHELNWTNSDPRRSWGY
jgi:prefoldin subunit 5